MKHKTVAVILKAAAFLLIGCFLFHLCGALLLEKNSYAKYRGWKLAEDVDILILGNSHSDKGLQAANMTAELSAWGDISVFNYSIFGMRMEQLLFFAREIFKTHVPDLIILETYAFCPLADEHREILARRAFDVFPLSRNKVEAIQYCVLDDPVSYYIPIIKYHTRWKELSSQDLSLLYDRSLWSTVGSNGSNLEAACPDPGDGWFQQEPPGEMELREITPSEKECLEQFLALLEERDIPLLFVSVPFKTQMDLDSMEQMKINNYLRERYVNDDTVQLLDMNRMWAELAFDYSDLNDEGHANISGAEKMTRCLLDYLKEHYDIGALAG